MKNKLSLLSIAVQKIRLLASYCKKNMLKGVLPGEFSVSPTKKIHFSKGNLYFNGSEFVFEAKQSSVASSSLLMGPIFTPIPATSGILSVRF